MPRSASRRRFLQYSAIAGGAILAGCIGSAKDSFSGYTTTVSVPALTYQFFVRLQNRFKQIVQQRQNMRGGLYEAQNSAFDQVSDIETAIAKDVDFIMISPITEWGVTTAIREANDANIPVINVDRAIKGANVATHIASNNVELGRRSTNLCLRFMKETRNKDEYNIIELRGTPGSSVANDRHEGFKRALRANDELTLLASQSGNFSSSGAVSLMEDFISAYGTDIDGVYAHNDMMALGAHEAIQGSNVGILPITGIDGIDTWVKMFSEHQTYGTIAQLPEKMITEATQLGIAVTQGKEVQDFYEVKAPTVTQQNAQEYLTRYFNSN